MRLLDRVTITGADDSIGPEELAWISELFPFVEWGILFHPSKDGEPRYPSRRWVERLLDHKAARGPCMRISAHLCGGYARKLLAGFNELPDVSMFQRVQLNFRSHETVCDVQAFRAALRCLDGKQVIFQLDGNGVNAHFDALCAQGCEQDYALLFDGSGGTGHLPDHWPKPQLRRPDGTIRYHGYAGGLGPRVLGSQLPRIVEAAGGTRIWIDMESKVRSRDDARFVTEHVWDVLSSAKAYVADDCHSMEGCRA